MTRGFTHIDDEARPATWVECLDALHGEPFYRQYKDRIRAILEPWSTGRYLEVGAGAVEDRRTEAGVVR